MGLQLPRMNDAMCSKRKRQHHQSDVTNPLNGTNHTQHTDTHHIKLWLSANAQNTNRELQALEVATTMQCALGWPRLAPGEPPEALTETEIKTLCSTDPFQ